MPKENFKLKKYLGLQIGQICFWYSQRKFFLFFIFSSFVAFQQTKKQI